MATKLEGGGGGKALVAGPLKIELYFFASSLTFMNSHPSLRGRLLGVGVVRLL